MCWSAMNLGTTWIGYILQKKGKEGNVSIKIKHMSLLKKKVIYNKFNFFILT